MLRIHPSDIAAIAAEVVRLMSAQSDIKDDAEYLATLSIEEVKRIQREKLGLNRRGK